MNERSYTELMKSKAMSRQNAKDAYMSNLYIDMLLDEILLNAEKQKLLNKIDQAIDVNDKPAFLQLTEELASLNKRFGT
ncbi:hypothetical protein CVD25_00895 [Bacillus canaveralius]|uniref:IDEAL domain-containing protein n=1 Tax=Bacillus canaveralius TaxID=1403243 RepID=A0A2N5GPI2_9BACI|nr:MULTISPECIES: IDEAL domain-containing protein [Bacillus]PLR84624.1 hypothetical protein CU635_06000 [Bacillus canaveralius]PLR87357.1 hypothetical protein CVD23_02975 [Bacillus sp. V33-4]PLS00776.1 hypothetical protein CVD25_00895 [Bacillus canaveralius]RSK53307.1 IDEAL domain-containing protein [Bacillus canaveralius]